MSGVETVAALLFLFQMGQLLNSLRTCTQDNRSKRTLADGDMYVLAMYIEHSFSAPELEIFDNFCILLNRHNGIDPLKTSMCRQF